MLKYNNITYNGKSIDCLKYNNKIIWLKLIEEIPLYIGTCLGNYVETDVTPDLVGKIETAIYIPESYTIQSSRKAVMFCGARNATGGLRLEFAIKVGDGSNAYGLYLVTNRSTLSKVFRNAAYGFLNVTLNEDNSYLVINSDNDTINHVWYENQSLNPGSCNLTFTIFDIHNPSSFACLKKPLCGYINYMKFYDTNGNLLRYYKALLVNSVPSLLEVTTNTIKPIIGTNPIYYFTDITNIQTYNP